MNSHVSLTFSLKYLVNFSKSGNLADTVQLMMSNDVPLLVSLSAITYSILCSFPSLSCSDEIDPSMTASSDSHFYLQVAYEFGPGHIHYYLAPKIGDE